MTRDRPSPSKNATNNTNLRNIHSIDKSKSCMALFTATYAIVTIMSTSVSAYCPIDSIRYKDHKNWTCKQWNGHNCSNPLQSDGYYTPAQLAELQYMCPRSCQLCATTTTTTTSNINDDDGNIYVGGMVWYFLIPVLLTVFVFFLAFVRRVQYRRNNRQTMHRQRQQRLQALILAAHNNGSGSGEALLRLHSVLELEHDACPIPLPTYEQSESDHHSRVTTPQNSADLPPSYDGTCSPTDPTISPTRGQAVRIAPNETEI